MELQAQDVGQEENINLEQIFSESLNKEIEEDTESDNLLIHLYQNHISTQDGSNCVFYPSCSDFAKIVMRESENKKRAIILITDRIQRCHISSFKTNQYEFDETHLRLSDPPNKYLKNN